MNTSLCCSYGPLSPIENMSSAVMRPSLLKPTLILPCSPIRTRPMKCSSSRLIRIITGAFAFFESSAGIAMEIAPATLLPNAPPQYSLISTTLFGSIPTQRATAGTVCIVLCVEQCRNSFPFCQ